MDFDRKKLKPMWAQFWASHQVSRLTPTHPGCSQAKLPLQQFGFNPISLASTTESDSLTSLQQLTNHMAMPHSLTSHLLSHPPSSSNLLAPNSFSHVSRLLPSSPVCLSLLQRFFKYLCIAAKVPEAIQLAKKALEDGKVPSILFTFYI